LSEAGLKVGTFLPTPASPGSRWEDPKAMIHAAQVAEALGFDSLWIGDHYLTSPVHHESWLDPVMVLTYLAAATSRIELGPAIVVSPVRHPVWLAKQFADLQSMAEGRASLAIATGFNPLEFAAVGVPLNERGRRQHEILTVLQALLSGEPASYDGTYFSFPEIIVEPKPTRRVPVYVAGGSQPDVTPDGVRQSVIDRIARSDGWVTPTYAPLDLLESDWRRIEAARAESPDAGTPFVFAHMNFVHVVDTDDGERARDEQKPLFLEHFTNRSWELIEQGHLIGGISEVVDRVQARLDLGVNHVSLQPVVRDPRSVEQQFRLIAERIVPQLEARGATVTGTRSV
jgi:probable F420-dependent oxidoreductase